MADGHELAAGRVAVNEGLAAHADEEQALVARVDEREEGEGDERRTEDGGRRHEREVALGAARARVSETHFVLGLSGAEVHWLVAGWLRALWLARLKFPVRSRATLRLLWQ